MPFFASTPAAKTYRPAREFALWVEKSRRILYGPLPKVLKRRLLWTNTALFARTLGGGSPGGVRCKILSFDVRAFSLWTLDLLFREIFVNLDYHFETKKVSPFIVDGGSNIGMAILFFKMLYPEAIVTGFEPEQECFHLLTDNLLGNNIGGVQVHPFALGASEGQVSFFRDDPHGSLMASTNPQRTRGGEATVRQVVLSSYMDREVDFLKLDVEGAEADVLSELVSSRAILNVSRMAVEYHHHIPGAGDKLGEFLALLEGTGYGYQISSSFVPHGRRGVFQDILVHAYRKC
jgi:FkbM family methyltransferase